MVEYPFRDVIEAMSRKDAKLCAAIQHLPVYKAVQVWRERYPEDFAGGDMSPFTVDQVHQLTGESEQK